MGPGVLLLATRFLMLTAGSFTGRISGREDSHDDLDSWAPLPEFGLR